MGNSGLVLLNSYALIILIVLSIVFFSKKRLHQVEDNTYGQLLIVSVITILFGLLLGIILDSDFYLKNLLAAIFNKIYLIGLILSVSIFAFYTYCISRFKNFKFKTVNKLYLGLSFINVLLVLILPLHVISENGNIFTEGPAMIYTYGIFSLIYLILIILVILDFKNIKNKKYIPIILLIFEGIMMVVIQVFKPELNYLINPSTVITCLIMYFTIENPDVQITAELYKNKKLIEKSNQDTSNFLFRMTQDIKKPVKDIIDISLKLQEYSNLKEIKEGIKYINNTADELDYLINDALDVSNMTTKRLKIFDARYNPVNIFKEISYRFEKQIDKDIKFNFFISSVIPSYLYGDSIKLKQAVNSILENALKHTESGEINLEVNGIIKYNICRLIITVSDTGSVMSIEEVNNILSLNSDALSDIDLRNRDDELLNLKEVKKLVSLLGGNLMVKSEENVGTTVSVVLEQKIVESKETIISKKLESYEQSLYRNKKVMVVDDDAKELSQITTWLENHDAEVSGSLFGRDVIEKIANNVKYDLIILDDETSTYSALDVLKELKKNKKFNTPVVVMINDNKEFIKLHYLQDGFADCIMKSKLESEINRIMKRF